MRYEIISKNYSIPDRLKKILDKKISKFDRYFNDTVSAKVNLTKSGETLCTMEITVRVNNKIIRSETTSDNMYDNMDVILPKLEKQILKYVHKFDKKNRVSEFIDEPIYTNFDESEVPKKTKVVKVKNFNLSKTTIDDAIEEMEMLGHNFYIFLNAEDNKVNVVYKRNDKNYGLIDPEY